MQKSGFELFSLIGLVSVAGLTACSSAPKVLSIKSFPAEADVCVKGRAGSELMDTKLNCIGQTPFEGDHFEYTAESGKKIRVNFRDLKSQESFFLVLKKEGYVTQSVMVPGWDQFLNLNKEKDGTTVQVNTAPASAALPIPAPVAPIALAPEKEKAKNGGLRILSNPPGALVYINGSLQGNTPYVYQYQLANGQNEFDRWGESEIRITGL